MPGDFVIGIPFCIMHIEQCGACGTDVAFLTNVKLLRGLRKDLL
jgi:hypothetical protein